MRSSFRISALLFSLMLLLANACKTTGTGTVTDGKTDLNTNGMNKFVEDNKTGLMKNEAWGTSLQEGWLNDQAAQALLTGESGKDVTPDTRKRLAWLLLLGSYDLQREDMPLADRLAQSKLFESFGQEKVFQTVKDGKSVVIVQRYGLSLKKDWSAMMEKMEAKETKLASLRRK